METTGRCSSGCSWGSDVLYIETKQHSVSSQIIIISCIELLPFTSFDEVCFSRFAVRFQNLYITLHFTLTWMSGVVLKSISEK